MHIMRRLVVVSQVHRRGAFLYYFFHFYNLGVFCMQRSGGDAPCQKNIYICALARALATTHFVVVDDNVIYLYLVNSQCIYTI